MPASAVEIRQLFAQPWSSDAGDGRCSWMGVNVVCAKVASPSSGCAAMGASAAIFFFGRRGDGVYCGATSLRELCGSARRATRNWQLVAKLGFASREMRFLAAQASVKRSLAEMLPRTRNLLQRWASARCFAPALRWLC